jgi:hypothetical protein
VSADAAEFAWWRLRQPGAGQSVPGISSIALEVRTAAGAVRLALGDAGEARVLIPLVASEAFPIVEDSRGITVRDTVLSADGRAIRFADITCREEVLEGVFSRLVQQIVSELDAGKAVATAVEGAVREFRMLLMRGGAVTVEAALGLLGELLVLEELMHMAPGAWRGWAPPDGRHDFRAGDAALEVKSTRRAAARRVTISSIDQLAAPEAGTLTLLWRCFEEHAGAPHTVPRAAARLIALADDPEGMEHALKAHGYEIDTAAAWDRFAFSTLGSEAYRVVEGFPRLLAPRGGLPRGVKKVRYDVELDAAAAYRLSFDEEKLAVARFIEALA